MCPACPFPWKNTCYTTKFTQALHFPYYVILLSGKYMGGPGNIIYTRSAYWGQSSKDDTQEILYLHKACCPLLGSNPEGEQYTILNCRSVAGSKFLNLVLHLAKCPAAQIPHLRLIPRQTSSFSNIRQTLFLTFVRAAIFV